MPVNKELKKPTEEKGKHNMFHNVELNIVYKIRCCRNATLTLQQSKQRPELDSVAKGAAFILTCINALK